MATSPNMDHEGYAARFAMTSVVYEDGKLPGYEGQLISGMALTSRMQATRLVADGSTFRTVDTDAVVTTADRSFRPVDTAVGPDGAHLHRRLVRHPDGSHRPARHLGQVVRTDLASAGQRTTGRWLPSTSLAGAARSSSSCSATSRKWYREQARRLLGERRDQSLVARLRRLARDERGQLALEALWTANLISGMDAEWALDLLDSPRCACSVLGTAPVESRGIDRAAAAREAGQAGSQRAGCRGEERARERGRAPRGCTTHLPCCSELIRRQEDVSDKHVPLRIWWALEEKITSDADGVLSWLEKAGVWQAPLFTEHLAGRIARRLAADRGDTPSFTRIDPDTNWKEYARHPRSRMPGGKGDYTEWETNYTPEVSDRSLTRLARLLEMAPATHRDRLLAGVQPDSSRARPRAGTSASRRDRSMVGRSTSHRCASRVAARLGHPEAAKARALAADRDSAGARARTAGTSPNEAGRRF